MFDYETLRFIWWLLIGVILVMRRAINALYLVR